MLREGWRGCCFVRGRVNSESDSNADLPLILVSVRIRVVAVVNLLGMVVVVGRVEIGAEADLLNPRRHFV